MLIGVISDTHDNLPSMDKALEIFNNAGVGLIVHCGDWVSPFSAEYFGKKAGQLNILVKAVFGNNEGDKGTILKLNNTLKTPILFPKESEYLEFRLEGKNYVICHGHIRETLESLINSGRYDAVFIGHTHIDKMEKLHGVVLINPGAACFIRKGVLVNYATVALFNTQTEKTDFIRFNENELI